MDGRVGVNGWVEEREWVSGFMMVLHVFESAVGMFVCFLFQIT